MSLLLGAQRLLPKSHTIVGNPINVHKWNNGVLNRNWSREFHYLTPEIDSGIFELYRVGVPAEILFKAGYEYKEMLKGGYSENELLLAGYIKP